MLAHEVLGAFVLLDLQELNELLDALDKLVVRLFIFACGCRLLRRCHDLEPRIVPQHCASVGVREACGSRI